MADGKFWVNNHAHVVAFNGRAELRYLEAVFRNFDLKPYLSGTAQPKLNRSSLDRISIPIPPFELQRSFVNRLKSTDAIRSSQQRSINTVDLLFASLQNRAFRGEL